MEKALADSILAYQEHVSITWDLIKENVIKDLESLASGS